MRVSTSGDVAFRFRDIWLVAYGPSIVSAAGHGAMLPVLALRARDLGADVSVAAAIVALLGVGQLFASLPAGALVARIGERRALVGAGLVDACAMVFAALTDSVLGLASAVLLSGVCWTLFLGPSSSAPGGCAATSATRAGRCWSARGPPSRRWASRA